MNIASVIDHIDDKDESTTPIIKNSKKGVLG